MKVRWTEFNHSAYNIASEFSDEISTKLFESTFEGEVIDKYHSFWGIPKFVVALPDGRIKTVVMRDCLIIENYGQKAI